MAEFLQFILLILDITFSLLAGGLAEKLRFPYWCGYITKHLRAAVPTIVVACLLGCFVVAKMLHEPVPRVHDEYSYLLMGETFSSGHLSNPATPLSKFFDTFHELMHPTYASKYFSAQGLFLALGQKITSHPIAGVWLSSALACAAAYWMLEAWITPTWAPFGSLLMAIQIGMFSYWSQSYWGGMVPALGGALFFGAARRLWDGYDWRRSLWLALGFVLLANSRPLEGFLAILPLAILCSLRLIRVPHWTEAGFWPKMALPFCAVMLSAVVAMGYYNRAITGSALKFPYVLHEEQYQESPPFIFMSMRKPITYSSFWVWAFYHNDEVRAYQSQRTHTSIVCHLSGPEVPYLVDVFLWHPFDSGFVITHTVKTWRN